MAERYAELERIKMEEDLLEEAKKNKKKNKLKKTQQNPVSKNHNSKFDHFKEMNQQQQ